MQAFFGKQGPFLLRKVTVCSSPFEKSLTAAFSYWWDFVLALLFFIQWQGTGVRGGSAVQPKVCICSVGMGMPHLDIHTGMSARRKLEDGGMLEPGVPVRSHVPNGTVSSDIL